MKRILLIIMSAFMLNANAQDERIQDSIDISRCELIVNDLFEGNLTKNKEIQKTHLPTNYYWCIIFEGHTECGNKFEKTYKKYLNKKLRSNMLTGDFEMTIKILDDEEKFILLHWNWIDKEDFDTKDMYFEFVVLPTNQVQLLDIQTVRSEYWEE